MSHRQQLRGQLVPPPPMPPPPLTARIHTTGIPTGSISPASRSGSDVGSSLVIQPPNYITHGRMPPDALFHSLSPSSHPEIRVQVGHEKEARNVVNEADIDPVLQAVSNARLQATSQLPVSIAPSLSLPSLKASGLLEWPRPGCTDAGVAPSSVQAGNWQPPTQHFAPARPQRDSARSFNPQLPPDGPRPPVLSASSSMPVGLQWLAHESSVSRPS